MKVKIVDAKSSNNIIQICIFVLKNVVICATKNAIVIMIVEHKR